MVERVERLLQRRRAVPLVHLVEVDVVRAHAAQARLAGADDVVAREPGVVGAVAHRHARLGGEQHAVAAAAQGAPDDLLGEAAGVDVGGVDQVDARLEAHVDLAGRAFDVGRADVGELVAAAEGHGAEGEGGHPETRAPELAIVHGPSLLRRVRRARFQVVGAITSRAPPKAEYASSMLTLAAASSSASSPSVPGRSWMSTTSTSRSSASPILTSCSAFVARSASSSSTSRWMMPLPSPVNAARPRRLTPASPSASPRRASSPACHAGPP